MEINCYQLSSVPDLNCKIKVKNRIRKKHLILFFTLNVLKDCFLIIIWQFKPGTNDTNDNFFLDNFF